MTLSLDDIQAEANTLGFLLVGVSAPHTPPHFAQYQQWIMDGNHASMNYLAKYMQIRAHPQRLMPECRAILSFALPYPNPLHAQNAPAHIAAYAWGKDYHLIIPQRMQELQTRLERASQKPCQWRTCSDAEPLMERDFAQQAGLGWFGKNSCLISPQFGSFFSLAELFTNQEISGQLPGVAEHCGTCQRCIQACPTGCIHANRTIDASRCISYLTIENKGSIPHPLRPLLGDWVFGCDVCQTVCPWNAKSNLPGDRDFQPLPEIQTLNLRAELLLNPEQFKQKYLLSPIRRTKRYGYLRNVATVLGNLGDPQALPILVLTLQTEREPLIRAAAAYALGRFSRPDARQALETALQHEPDASVKEEIQIALSGQGSQAGLPAS